MTNIEKFAEVFGYRPIRRCIAPPDDKFDCGDGDCGQCPYWKWFDKEYTGRRDVDGEAEYCAKFQSAGAKRSE